ncbi:hypothetical protein ABZW49_10070 [Nonomuraea wenchangensis]
MPKPHFQDPPPSALFAIKYSYVWLRTWREVIAQPSVKLVGFAAATFSNRSGHRVFPGLKLLMATTGYSKPTVIDALATMRYLGFVYRVESNRGATSHLADRYQLCTPRTLDHVPMLVDKEEPDFASLNPVAQRVAIRICVAKRLGWSTETTRVVNSVDLWWLSQLTTTTHTNHTSHHSDRHDRHDARASRQYDFSDEDDCFDYVYDHVPYLDPMEASTVEGMIAREAHPKAIVNSILAARRNSAA